MNRRLAFSAFVAAATATTALAAGATTGWGGRAATAGAGSTEPRRDRAVRPDDPAYANQFDMPNFRQLRDSGTDFKKAYLGYMASETVIAHNVITSGLEPRHMGWTDEAYRDHGNVFGKGADQMHITGDLSLSDFALIEKNNGVAYPKLADYLHTAYPGTEFITVGEKSYAVESATGATGDIAVRLSSRRSNLTATPPTGCSNLSIPGVPGNGQWRSPTGKNVPTYLNRTGPERPDPVWPLLHQRGQGQRQRHEGRLPVVALPGRGQPLRPGQRPGAPRRRHVGGRRGDRDDAPRELVGHVHHHGRHRQGRPHVGSAGRQRAAGLHAPSPG